MSERYSGTFHVGIGKNGAGETVSQAWQLADDGLAYHRIFAKEQAEAMSQIIERREELILRSYQLEANLRVIGNSSVAYLQDSEGRDEAVVVRATGNEPTTEAGLVYHPIEWLRFTMGVEANEFFRQEPIDKLHAE